MSYVFTYDLSRQGYNEMIQKLDEHSNNRKDALNKCYNQIRTNYFKNIKIVIVLKNVCDDARILIVQAKMRNSKYT